MYIRDSKFKNIVINIVVVCMVFLSGTNIFASGANFSDINGHWAESYINEFSSNGYIGGYSDGTFRPNNSITRAEFVAVLNNVFGFEQSKQVSFKDVKLQAWYYDDVCIAAQAGYIKGYADGTFRPNATITREEVASIITSIKDKKDSNLDKIIKYKDFDQVSTWARPSVEGSVEYGYMSGYSDNTFGPKKGITRAEAVVTISRTQKTEISNPYPVVTMYTTADSLNVRSGPGSTYSIVGSLIKGTAVEVVGEKDGWANIKYNGSYAYVSKSFLTDTKPSQSPLPIPTSTPSYIDVPQNPGVIDPMQDIYQDKINVSKVNDSGSLTSLEITTNGEFEISYQTYANGTWSNWYNGGSGIEGVKINLTGAPSNYHVFYRTKIKNQGWQGWVKDGDISGEIENGNVVEDIQVRIIVSSNADSMVKPTIAVDIGHNVSLAGAIDGIYKESYLNKVIGEKVIYKLRNRGYNVVNTLPKGSYTQSGELAKRTQIANSNGVDKFVSIHFNSSDNPDANGTEVFYSTKTGSYSMAKSTVDKISSAFGFSNRGAKDGSHLAVLRNTNMAAILVEGCFITSKVDMEKFISKGSNAYDIIADNIISGILNN